MATSSVSQTGHLLRQTVLRLTSPSITCVRYKHYIPSPRNFKEKLQQEKDLSWSYPLIEWPTEKQKLEEQAPSPLHMVIRVQPLKGRPHWERKVAKRLGLGEDTKKFTKVILKNSFETNSLLKKIKHLVEIKPVTFPYGLPDDESDFEHCYLRDNGEFVVKKKIPAAESNESTEVTTTQERENTLWSMDKETLLKHCKKKADDRDINYEYFKPDYEYGAKPSSNEVHDEYRYFGDKARRKSFF